MSAPASGPVSPRDVWSALTRPYRVTPSMGLLALCVPAYVAIAGRAGPGAAQPPALSLDAWVPLAPGWSLVYGGLYLYLIVLPVLVVQREALVRRTARAYLLVWVTACACFWLYPTVAPRPAAVPGDGFAAWCLRFIYHADPPHNCLPSLHVAHSVVSALACRRVHRGVGALALVCAGAVAASTLFIKQHYAIDVVAGAALAAAAGAIFLRDLPPPGVAERRVAPALAACAAGGVGAVGVGCLAAWLWSGG